MSNLSLLILCAGFGKRMLNLTSNTPKPLLKFKNKILLDNTINFFTNIGFDEIFINTHYKHKSIEKHLSDNFNNSKINLVYEPSILGTGGGIKNIFNYTSNEKICVVNSDIFWKSNNKLDVLNFLKDFDDVSCCKILLSEKDNLIGLKNIKGDFKIKNNIILNWNEGDEVMFYTGLQIITKKIFQNMKQKFPINDVWKNLIVNKNLNGSIIKSKIFHIGDKKTFVSL